MLSLSNIPRDMKVKGENAMFDRIKQMHEAVKNERYYAINDISDRPGPFGALDKVLIKSIPGKYNEKNKLIGIYKGGENVAKTRKIIIKQARGPKANPATDPTIGVYTVYDIAKHFGWKVKFVDDYDEIVDVV